jgi:hypothetical protein
VGPSLLLPLAVVVLPLLFGWLGSRPDRCPHCKVRAVRPWWRAETHARPSPWFYRCERCGLRLKRVINGPWEDASGVEYDGYYVNAPPLPLGPISSYRTRG